MAGSFPILPTSEQVRAQQATVAHIVSTANSVFENRVAFTRLRMFNVPESAFQVNVAQELGLADPPTDPLSFGLPFFNVTNYSLVTDSPSAPQSQRDNLWHLSSRFSRTRARHTWKAGFELLSYQMNYLRSNLSRGQYNYAGAFTSVDGSGVDSGDPFADFLLGFPQQTMRTRGSSQAYLRQHVPAVYLHDDWRVRPGLTVNLGLRYEYASPYTEKRNRLLNLDYSTLPKAPLLTPVVARLGPGHQQLRAARGARVAVREGHGFSLGLWRVLQPGDRDRELRPHSEQPQNENNQTQGSRAPSSRRGTASRGPPRPDCRGISDSTSARARRTSSSGTPGSSVSCPDARCSSWLTSARRARSSAGTASSTRRPTSKPARICRRGPAICSRCARSRSWGGSSSGNTSPTRRTTRSRRSWSGVSRPACRCSRASCGRRRSTTPIASSPACTRAPERRTSAICGWSAAFRSATRAAASPPRMCTACPMCGSLVRCSGTGR